MHSNFVSVFILVNVSVFILGNGFFIHEPIAERVERLQAEGEAVSFPSDSYEGVIGVTVRIFGIATHFL